MDLWCKNIENPNCYGPFTNIRKSAHISLNSNILENLINVAGHESKTPHWLSGNGQDWFVWYNHARFMKKPGTYIDLAANHPIWRSNTFFFDGCMNWKGLCIEASETHYRNLKKMRSCKVIPQCISDKENVLFVDNIGFKGGASKVVNSLKYKGLRGNVITKNCTRLDTLFKNENIKHVDFLSLDIEGHELNALSTIDFEYTNIDIIISENGKIWPLLKNRYRRYPQKNSDYIYLRKGFKMLIEKNGMNITRWNDLPACYSKCLVKSC